MPFEFDKEGYDDVTPEAGVYDDVQFGYIEPEPFDAKGKFPGGSGWRSFLKFSFPTGESGTWAVDCGMELRYAVWNLTSYQVQLGETDDPQLLHQAAVQALENVQWSGRAYMGPKFMSAPTLPVGGYRFRFLGFVNRNEAGEPERVMAPKRPDDERDRYYIRYFAQVTKALDPKWVGFVIQASVPVAYTFNEKGDIGTTKQAAWNKWLPAMGVTAETFATTKFDPKRNPMPKVEAALLDLSERGHEFDSYVGDDGRMRWDNCSAAEGTEIRPAEGIDWENDGGEPEPPIFDTTDDDGVAGSFQLLVEILEEIASKASGHGEIAANEDGTELNDAGKAIVGSLVRATLKAFPDSGVKLFWPPQGVPGGDPTNVWEPGALEQCVVWWSVLPEQESGWLVTHLTADDAMQQEIAEYLLKRFGGEEKPSEPPVAPATVQSL